MEKGWEKFRDMVIEHVNDGCGMIRVGWQRTKVSEWLHEEVGLALAEKS